MGLDQYIYKAKEVAYFRKCNFIQHWMEEHFNDGSRLDSLDTIQIDLDALKELKKACEKVMDMVEEVQSSTGETVYELKAGYTENDIESILPTEAGFFFGDTGYGKMYFDDVKNTIIQLDMVIRTSWEDDTFFYHCWY